MLDFIWDYIWEALIALVSVVAYIVRIEQGMKRNEERYLEMQKNIEKLENNSVKGREDVKREIADLHKTMQNNFDKVDATLEKVIFKLGDKADKG